MITSAQSGGWLDTTTWIGGIIPSDSDDVVISDGHTITITSEVRREGNVVIGTGASLVLGASGDILGTLILAGCDITGAGSLRYYFGWLKSDPSTWSYVRCSKFDPTSSSACYLSCNLRNVTFDGCSEVRLYQNSKVDPNNEHEYVLENTVFRNIGKTYLIYSSSNTNLTELHINKCTFWNCTSIFSSSPKVKYYYDKCLLYSDDFTSELRHSASANEGKQPLYTNCVLINFEINYSIGGGTLRNCFTGSDFPANGASYVFGAGGGSDLVEYCVGHVTPECVNNRMCNQHIMTGNFIQDDTVGGSNTFSSSTKGHWTYNVVLAKSSGFTSIPSTSIPVDFDISNNTFFGAENFATFERETPLSGSVVNVNNNMFFASNVEFDAFFFHTMNALAGPLNVDMDYNYAVGITGWQSPEVVNSSGTNNVLESLNTFPQFVDPTRTVQKWAGTQGVAETSAALFTHLKNLNGYDDATQSHSNTALSDTVVVDMREWLVGGYVPQNMSLATAGKAGSYVGAAEPKSIVVETANLSLNVDKLESLVNTLLTYTITIDEVLSSDLTATLTIDGVDRFLVIQSNQKTATTSYTPTIAKTVIAEVKNTDNDNVTIVKKSVSTVVTAPAIVATAQLHVNKSSSEVGEPLTYTCVLSNSVSDTTSITLQIGSITEVIRIDAGVTSGSINYTPTKAQTLVANISNIDNPNVTAIGSSVTTIITEPKPEVRATAILSANKSTSKVGEPLLYIITLSNSVEADTTVTVKIKSLYRQAVIIAGNTIGNIYYTPSIAETLVATITSVDNPNVTVVQASVSTVIENAEPPVPPVPSDSTTGLGRGKFNDPSVRFIATTAPHVVIKNNTILPSKHTLPKLPRIVSRKK